MTDVLANDGDGTATSSVVHHRTVHVAVSRDGVAAGLGRHDAGALDLVPGSASLGRIR